MPFETDCIYHVYNHGNAEELIFREDINYAFFLKRYRKYIPAIAEAYAYCLMLNPVKYWFTDEPDNWAHSSYKRYLSDKRTLLKRKEVLHWFVVARILLRQITNLEDSKNSQGL